MEATYSFSEINWTCADHHFGHPRGRILHYQPERQRWCANMKEMEELFITSWNAVVAPDHTVLHLGDLNMHPRREFHALVARLNGRIILVRGNHDRSRTSCSEAGLIYHTSVRVEDQDGRAVSCRHNPQDFTQDEVDESELLIHGHLHGLKEFRNCPAGTEPKARDVGVDALNSHVPLAWGWSTLYDANI